MKKNLAIFTVILMATFGTKNVHSALVLGIFKPWIHSTYFSILASEQDL